MRAGYASILVSRTRGGAPLLRPATPSRFEPETRLGEMARDMNIDTLVDATPQPPAAHSRTQRPSHELDVGRPSPWTAYEPDEPLLGWHRPIEEQSMVDARTARHGQPAPWAPTDDAAEHRHGIATPRAPRPGQSRMPGERAALPAAPEPTESASAPWALDASPTALQAPQATPEPPSAVEVRMVTPRAEHESVPALRSATEAEHGGAQPPVIVRIGRLEVRAVQAPPAPTAAARPRRRAGPTLEERLAARDRQ